MVYEIVCIYFTLNVHVCDVKLVLNDTTWVFNFPQYCYFCIYLLMSSGQKLNDGKLYSQRILLEVLDKTTLITATISCCSGSLQSFPPFSLEQ